MLPISDKPAHSTMTNRELAGIRRPRLVRFCSPHAAEKRALDTWINNSDSSATSWNRCQRRCRARYWWRQAISTSMCVCSRSRARTARGAHGRAVARRRWPSLAISARLPNVISCRSSYALYRAMLDASVEAITHAILPVRCRTAPGSGSVGLPCGRGQIPARKRLGFIGDEK